jgi:hypothetical protein
MRDDNPESMARYRRKVTSIPESQSSTWVHMVYLNILQAHDAMRQV